METLMKMKEAKRYTVISEARCLVKL